MCTIFYESVGVNKISYRVFQTVICHDIRESFLERSLSGEFVLFYLF